MFKHFLFTRFNLRFDKWETTKSGSLVLSEAWLTERFRLFETYCLPSVQNQSNQNFTWFVFFDIQTPDLFKEKIGRLEKQYANLHPVFIDGGAEFRSGIINTIKANLTAKDQYVLSSRIDNDDTLHKDFMATVQQLFRPVHNHVIDIRTGYQLILEKGKSEVLEFNYSYNPFVSLVEAADGAKSVFSRDHKDWNTEPSVTAYTKRRLWVQVVHSNNLINWRRNRLRAAYRFDHSDFGLEKSLLHLPGPLQVLFFNSYVNVLKLLSLCKKKAKQLLLARPA